ncbi:hypothetical protein JCM19235_5082 [Vibrio maritimus]|uniref:Uncharacterized protein n=1 Tax=Vibrio maritimus TaxID=990268 RepID=A0A090RPT4_9VIBR|nr:hypothetical protein JCM19235_5082 [Vibrio maritimus]
MKLSVIALSLLAATSAHAALDLYDPSNNETDNLVWVGHMSQIQTQFLPL